MIPSLFDLSLARCVYGLDRVLSIALGRPSGTHDDDCDAEMRECALSCAIKPSLNTAAAAQLTDEQVLASCEGEALVPTDGCYMTGFVA